jgi:hypothetical protein
MPVADLNPEEVRAMPDHTVREYKVLTMQDKWASGKFEPEKLESALNAHAKQGWRLCGVATASIRATFSSDRDEIIFILER